MFISLFAFLNASIASFFSLILWSPYTKEFLIPFANNIADKYDDKFLDPFKKSASNITEEESIKLAREFVEMNEAIIPLAALKEEPVKEGIQAILETKVANAIIDAINSSSDAIELSNKEAFKALNESDKNSIIEVALKRSSI